MYPIWQQCIRSKITGEADDILELYGTGVEWDEIKTTLITHYSDKRDEVSLTRDLIKIRQKGDVKDYYGEISHVVSLLVNLLNLNEPNHDVKMAKNRFYQQMGLKVFLAGLKDPLGPIIRAQSPQTLRDALRLCLEEANYHFSKPASKEYFFSKPRVEVPPEKRPQPHPRALPIQQSTYRPFYQPVFQQGLKFPQNDPQPGPSWRVPTNQFANNTQAPSLQQRPVLPPRKMVLNRPEPMDVDRSLRSRLTNFSNPPQQRRSEISNHEADTDYPNYLL